MDKEIFLASEQQVEEITNLVQCTIKEIYAKYYRDEVVSFFCKWHSMERILADVEAKKVYVMLSNDKIVATRCQCKMVSGLVKEFSNEWRKNVSNRF